MLKTLVPIDGSESALRALRHVLALRREGLTVEIHLINVQIPIASGHAKMFINSDEYNRYCQEEALVLLAPARAILLDVGADYRHHVVVGHIAESIARFAREQKMDNIVMGTRGMSTVSDLVMGSVAHKVIHLAAVPVTLVK
jgi:nucleotide-binding universal stress UspA family protein